MSNLQKIDRMIADMSRNQRAADEVRRLHPGPCTNAEEASVRLLTFEILKHKFDGGSGNTIRR